MQFAPEESQVRRRGQMRVRLTLGWLAVWEFGFGHPLIMSITASGARAQVYAGVCPVSVRDCAGWLILVILGGNEYVKPGWSAVAGRASSPPARNVSPVGKDPA